MNGNDKFGAIIKKNNPKKTITFGNEKLGCKSKFDFVGINEKKSLIGTKFDFVGTNEKMSLIGTKFDCVVKDKKGVKTFSVTSKLVGNFNEQNILCAIAICDRLGFNLQKIINSIPKINRIAGRFDFTKYGNNCNVIVDYAHTFDSLKNLLETIKKLSKNKNIIVFGCPGERDTEKRQQMGNLASKFCDVVIITSDNPASENARRIIWEIEQGTVGKKAKVFCIENRKKAIKKAFSLAKKDTNLLIVGKGVEDYQIIGDKKVPYSDYEEVEKCLEK